MRSIKKKQDKFEIDLSNISAYVDKNYDVEELAKTFGRSKNHILKILKILSKKKIVKEFI